MLQPSNEFRLTYAEALRRPKPITPIQLRVFNAEQTSELFRRMKGYDGAPDTVVRQFSCRTCNKMWWKRVRSIKQVSKCKWCFKKYDPIPADLEFGCGFFKCYQCDNTYLSRIQMGHQAKCYTCQSMNLPMYILNREKEVIKFNTQTRNRHSCAMCMGNRNCPSMNQILAYSELHASTGSTLASLRDQSDLDERFVDDFANERDDLPSIRETSSDNDDSS